MSKWALVPLRVLLLLGVTSACSDPVYDDSSIRIDDALAYLEISTQSRLTAVQVGERIYKDKNISRTRNQSCESCHIDSWGFGPPGDGSIGSLGFAFYEGSVAGRFGDRRPPTSAYTFAAPPLFWDGAPENVWRGGLFWDGRAAGLTSVGRSKGKLTLVGPIWEQAMGPFRSAVEHAFSITCALYAVSISPYRSDFERQGKVRLDRIPFGGIPGGAEAFCYGGDLNSDPADYPPNFSAADRSRADEAYLAVGRLIAEFEASPRVSPFNSRFDSGKLTPFELQGKSLFEGKALCASCHMSEDGAGPEIFTDFSYYNIGVPRHPQNPHGADWRDPGIGPVVRALFPGVGDQQADGHFKSPSLRNVARTVRGGPKTYMHNGVLRSLEEVVHFYSTRDEEPCAPGAPWEPHDAGDHLKDPGNPLHCWPAPDFPNNNLIGAGNGLLPEIGNLGLTATQEAAIVAYMGALTDGVTSKPDNRPPMAAFTFSCTGTTCAFDGTSSIDEDGSISAWAWVFADAGEASGATATRTFDTPGTRTVTLIVTDNAGATAATAREVTTVSLTATLSKVKGSWAGNLTWSGASGQEVDVFRNGTRIASRVTASSWQDVTKLKGSGSLTYRVCLTAGGSCSETVTLSF